MQLYNQSHDHRGVCERPKKSCIRHLTIRLNFSRTNSTIQKIEKCLKYPIFWAIFLHFTKWVDMISINHSRTIYSQYHQTKLIFNWNSHLALQITRCYPYFWKISSLWFIPSPPTKFPLHSQLFPLPTIGYRDWMNKLKIKKRTDTKHAFRTHRRIIIIFHLTSHPHPLINTKHTFKAQTHVKTYTYEYVRRRTAPSRWIRMRNKKHQPIGLN